jgi:methionyl-tRNA formyltransferase
MSGDHLTVALFASDAVGAAVARIIRDRGDRVALAVLDRHDERGSNDAIREALAHRADAIIDDSELHTEAARERLENVDLALLAWWPRIIPTELLSLPRRGFLNFHPSLLPFNRGKNYNFWALVEQAPFGVTIHWVGDQIDGGDIAFQVPLPTNWEDTGQTLYEKARAAMVELFAASYDRIMSGDIPRVSQDLSAGSFHRAAELDEASRIALDKQVAARDLLNLMRARTFPPYPGAWFVEDGERYEVRIDIRKVERR